MVLYMSTLHYDNTSLNYSYNDVSEQWRAIKTQILCSLNFPEYRAIFEVELKNMVQPGRPHITL